MPIFKNVASQKCLVYAYDKTTGAAKTGDAANITGAVSLDGAAGAATNDVNPTEIDSTNLPGVYCFDLTQAETDGNLFILSAKSATSNILLDPVIAYTQLPAIAANVTEISGDSTAADNLEAAADGTGYNLGGGDIVAADVTLKTGYSLAAAQAFDLTGNITGNLSGTVGSVTGNVGGNVTGSVGSVASFGTLVADIASAVWAAGARTLTGFGTLVADIWANATRSLTDKIGFALTAAYDAAKTAATQASVDAVKTDSGNLVTRLTATRAGYLDQLEHIHDDTNGAYNNTQTLVGRVVGTIAAGTHQPQSGDAYGVVNNGTYGNSAINTAMAKDSTVAKDATVMKAASYTAPDNAGIAAIGIDVDALPNVSDIDTALSATHGAGPWGAAAVPTPGEIADAVLDEMLSEHQDAGSVGAGISAASSAGDPWTTLLPGIYGEGTAGKIVGDNIDAAISSRSSHSADDVWSVGTRTLSSFGTLVADIASAVWAAGARTLTGFGSLIADIWANATRSLTDKAGYTLTAAYDAAKTASSQSSVDLKASQVSVDSMATAVGSKASQASVNALGTPLQASSYVAPPTTGDIADAVWEEDISTHDTDGSAGAVLVNSNDPLAVEVPGTYPVGTAGYNIGNMATVTSGANQVTIAVALADDTPIPDVQVSILNSDQSAIIKLGKTDALGVFTTSLDSGTYKVRLSKSMVNFTTPQTLVVDGAESVTYTGSEIEPDVTAGAQTLIVIPEDSSLLYESGVSLYADVSDLNSYSGTVSIVRDRVTGVNHTTYFSLVLAKGVKYRVCGKSASGEMFIDKTITVTNDDTKNIVTY